MLALTPDGFKPQSISSRRTSLHKQNAITLVYSFHELLTDEQAVPDTRRAMQFG